MVDLQFDHVSKRYRIRAANAEDGLLNRLRRRGKDFWAVRDVSFVVRRGEALGIIGHNGAGKSTVLKLLSSITAPTLGEITINGRLSALLEVGSGFHPELSGRENVYLSGAILGMRRSEITAKMDDIIDFAEVEQFIDVPVKRYSSGMFVRLGFAIAAHLNPDILLLDEVLAVGDAAFQEKCINRVMELRDAGKTIVFISHDLTAVERLCSRVLLMKQGAIIAEGTASEIIVEYRQSAVFVPSRREEHFGAAEGAEVIDLRFFDDDGHEATKFETGKPMRVRVHYRVYRRVENAFVGVFFYPMGRQLDAQFTTKANNQYIDLDPGEGVIEFRCKNIAFQPGVYDVDVAIEQYGRPRPLDWHYHCSSITVESGPIDLTGHFFMAQDWRFVAIDESVPVQQSGRRA